MQSAQRYEEPPPSYEAPPPPPSYESCLGDNPIRWSPESGVQISTNPIINRRTRIHPQNVQPGIPRNAYSGCFPCAPINKMGRAGLALLFLGWASLQLSIGFCAVNLSDKNSYDYDQLVNCTANATTLSSPTDYDSGNKPEPLKDLFYWFGTITYFVGFLIILIIFSEKNETPTNRQPPEDLV